MKISSTLKFFLIVVASLMLLCVVFPRNGVKLFGVTLHFPKLHEVLVREKEKDMDDLIVHKKHRDFTGVRDSIEDCYHALFEGPTRFWLPDDDVSSFDKFFRSAEKAESQKRTVRVMHYGDSQIEQDRITCRIRELLQAKFGGGGPGMLPLRQPVATITFSQSSSGSLIGQSTWGDSTFVRAAGNYGPMLRSWRLTGTATLSLSAVNNKNATERVGHFSSVRVLFNNRPGPLAISMRNRKGAGNFSETVTSQGIHEIAWRLDSNTTSAALTFNGTADIYGIMVDDGYGVAVDNIGMRSTSGHQFRMVDFDMLKESYRILDVGMIIMQFGGNSATYLKTQDAINKYCNQIGKQIDYVHSACPEAAILFVGPSDMSTMVNGKLATLPMLPTLIHCLCDTVTAHGAAFWSIYDAMGGKNSMVVWNKNGYAGADYVHFSIKGAALMGDYLGESILKLYELYYLRRKLTSDEFSRIWKEIKDKTPKQ